MWAYQIYIWEDHMGRTVVGGLEEKVKTAQKATASHLGRNETESELRKYNEDGEKEFRYLESWHLVMDWI